MAARKIVILGGTGFVGRALCQQLSDPGLRIIIPSRASVHHRDLLVVPGVVLVDGDVHDPVFLRQQFAGAEVVINLVGILNERGHSGAGFQRVHAELPAKVASACREEGVPRLLHMSALHANSQAPSHYLRTKAAGEDAAHAAKPDVHVTSFRPSVIFGPGDSFINRFARLLNFAPGVFPLACANARFQPVYVEDVARAFVAAIDMHRSHGQRYDLCGPRVYTLREIVSYIATCRGRSVRVIGLSDSLSRLQANVLEYAPGKPFSRDNFQSLKVDAVCRGDSALKSVFGIEPTQLENVVPGYLGRNAA